MTASNRLEIRAMLAVSAMVLVAGVWFLMHRQFDIDELEHAHASWSAAQGAVPYRDFFEHHSPALYLLFAPLFRVMTPAAGIDAASRTLVACRSVMWLLAVVAMALTYRIAEQWNASRRGLTGALSVVLLATSFQFVNTMIEFRPDVPALVCVLTAVACLFEAERSEPIGRRRWHLAAGVAFGASLMFTQKTIFAAPGLVVGVVAARRLPTVVSFLAGVALPIAAVCIWFAAHGAFGALIDGTIIRNVAINADRGSPLPGLFGSALRNLPLYACGLAGAVAAWRAKGRGARAALLATLGSLAAGIAIIGRVYDQYYLLMLPLLAVLGAVAIVEWAARKSWSLSWTSAAVVIATVALLAAVVVARYESNRRQLDDMRFTMERVAPDESVLSGIPGAGTFRPHAWYYFFLVGPFANDDDYAALRSALDAGRIRPRLVVFDARVQAMPKDVLSYLHEHYEAVRGELSMRRD